MILNGILTHSVHIAPVTLTCCLIGDLHLLTSVETLRKATHVLKIRRENVMCVP